MSPNTPNDFIGSLVEMAEAYRELPKVQAERDQLREALNREGEIVASREESILRYKAEIDQLHFRIRELEVSRDEAQFHALEADDRTSRALDFIRATFGNAGALIQALEPPREPEPIAATPEVPMQAVPEAAAEGELKIDSPFVSADMSTPNAHIESVSAPDTATGSNVPAPEVAASPEEPDASASTTDTVSENVAQSLAAPSPSDAGSAPPDAPTVDPSAKPVGPYTGRTYSSVVATGQWPTRDQWEAGGGTVDNWFA